MKLIFNGFLISLPYQLRAPKGAIFWLAPISLNVSYKIAQRPTRKVLWPLESKRSLLRCCQSDWIGTFPFTFRWKSRRLKPVPIWYVLKTHIKIFILYKCIEGDDSRRGGLSLGWLCHIARCQDRVPEAVQSGGMCGQSLHRDIVAEGWCLPEYLRQFDDADDPSRDWVPKGLCRGECREEKGIISLLKMWKFPGSNERLLAHCSLIKLNARKSCPYIPH